MSSDRDKLLSSAQKWVDKKRYDRALEDYQKVVALDPNDARTLLKIGDLQARMGSYADAIGTYDRVGQFYAAQGFALKAIAVYKQIRELIRKHAPELAERYGHILPRLADIYTQLGLTSDALQAYDEVATRLQRGGRDREAIDIFRRMVALDATNPLPHLRLAEACCRVQSLDDAIDAFWTAAELLLKLGRQGDALKVVERILHFRPEPRFARLAAELYLARDTREDGLQALAKLQICFQADPRDIDTLTLLAQAFTLIGQPEKAIEVYKEMARIARDSDRADLFEQLLEHLQNVAPDDEGVQALVTSAAPPREPSSVHVEDADLELIEEEELVEPAQSDEAPFELSRASRPDLHRPQAPAFGPAETGPDVVVVDEAFEVAEELVQPGTLNAEEHAQKAIVDAESFRRLRLYSKALEVIHIALEIDPRSTDVREKLREILIESGARDGAIGESVTLASLYLERGEHGRAEVLLYEVLEVEPNHPLALELLNRMGGGAASGYGWQNEATTTAGEYEAAGQYQGDQEPQYAGPAEAAYPEPYYEPAYDPNAPLPSYDLEEVSASSAMASTEPFEVVDDPFANVGTDEPFAMDQPLPAFPLAAEAARGEAGHGPPTEPAETIVDVDPTLQDTSTEPAENVESVEEALEEAEFFTARGLYEDAKAILTDQLSRAPANPLLMERLREIEGAIAAAGESRTIDRSQLGPSAERDEDRSFDIAASLEALDHLEVEEPSAPAASTGSDVDVDQVFAKFKEGVRAQVSENDSATHYDLGVAYKEMGLLGDAIGEFEVAAKDPTRECMCFAMIGMIHLERSELDPAAKAYVRALEAPHKTVEQEMALYYDLGNVHEMKGSAKDALYYFKKIARRDPGYRGVSDRIAALEPEAAPAPAPRAVNDDDEFDRVFDDLFESK